MAQGDSATCSLIILQNTYPHFDLDEANFVRKVHQVLSNMGAEHHDDLPWSGLPFLLAIAFDEYDHARDDDDALEHILKSALRSTKRAVLYAKQPLTSNNSHTTRSYQMVSILEALKDSLLQQQHDKAQAADEIERRYEEAQPNTTPDTLLTKAAQALTVRDRLLVQLQTANYVAFLSHTMTRSGDAMDDGFIEMVDSVIKSVMNGY